MEAVKANDIFAEDGSNAAKEGGRKDLMLPPLSAANDSQI